MIFATLGLLYVWFAGVGHVDEISVSQNMDHYFNCWPVNCGICMSLFQQVLCILLTEVVVIYHQQQETTGSGSAQRECTWMFVLWYTIHCQVLAGNLSIMASSERERTNTKLPTYNRYIQLSSFCVLKEERTGYEVISVLCLSVCSCCFC